MDSNELNSVYCELSIKIDNYIHTGDIDNLKTMELICSKYISDYPKIAYAFWYCKANIVSALFQLVEVKGKCQKLQNTDKKAKQTRVVSVDPNWKPLLYLRQAVKHDSFEKCPLNFKATILTNLGNAFYSVKRFIEAIEYYDQAIACVPVFAMALYHRGESLFKLANWMTLNPEANTDPAKIYFLYVEAQKSFEQAFQEEAIWETHPDHIEVMRKKYREHWLPHIYKIQAYNAVKSYRLHSDDFLKGSTEEVTYKKWLLKEHLYLDPINLISVYDIGGYDYLSFPSYSYRRGEDQPEFFNWFRLLKQEYIAARYLLFQSINLKDKKHFADENTDLFSPNEAELKYFNGTQKNYKNNFSFNLETALMKSSFTKAYGLFDKIAEFVFAFWQLEDIERFESIKIKKPISIGNIWYNNFDVKQGLNIKLINENNFFLKGLHHLSYDIVGKEIPKEYILPEFKQLQKIRNKLEHSGVMIIDDKHAISSKQLMTISREEFMKYNISLLHLVRNALFYLSLSVNLDQYGFPKNSI